MMNCANGEKHHQIQRIWYFSCKKITSKSTRVGNLVLAPVFMTVVCGVMCVSSHCQPRNSVDHVASNTSNHMRRVSRRTSWATQVPSAGLSWDPSQEHDCTACGALCWHFWPLHSFCSVQYSILY